MTNVDISVITDSVCERLQKCVDLCNERGITTEIVSSIESARGDYVCVPPKAIYFHPLFLSTQFIALWFQDNRKTSYKFSSKIVSGELIENDEVYFWKKDTDKHDATTMWVEPNHLMVVFDKI